MNAPISETSHKKNNNSCTPCMPMFSLGTVLCSWARHLTLTVPLSTQEYKWEPANRWGNLTNCGGVTCDGLASRPGGVEILLAASCYIYRDKLWQLRVIRLQGFTCFSLIEHDQTHLAFKGKIILDFCPKNT